MDVDRHRTDICPRIYFIVFMKKKIEKIREEDQEPVQDPNDDLKDFIRKKNIQNKVLKEMIDKLKSDGREIKE